MATAYLILLLRQHFPHTGGVAPQSKTPVLPEASRRSPGRPPMPRDEIIAAALRLVDEDGPDALSLRALAQKLGSSTATLYRHFESRAVLLAEVVDRLLGEVRIDPERVAAMSWQNGVTAYARALFEVLLKHRRAASLVGEHIPVGSNGMLLREGVLRLLLQAGFPPATASLAYSTVARHVLGFAMQITADPAVASEEDALVSDYVRRLDAKRYPATVAAADALPIPLKDEFAFGLRLIISGLEAECAAKRD